MLDRQKPKRTVPFQTFLVPISSGNLHFCIQNCGGLTPPPYVYVACTTIMAHVPPKIYIHTHIYITAPAQTCTLLIVSGSPISLVLPLCPAPTHTTDIPPATPPTHNGVLEEVILPLVLLEEEDVVVFAWPGGDYIHHVLVVLQLSF